MTEEELDQLIEEGQAIIAKAEKSVEAQKQFDAQHGISEDFFADVMDSDQCTPQFKELIEKERAAVMEKINEEDATQSPSGSSSKIGTRKGVTRI